jgi:ATP-binding cassette, subfamily B, bacterial
VTGLTAEAWTPPRMVRSLVDRSRRWLSMAWLLRRAGWPVVICSVLANLVIGLLPIVFITGASVMMARIPAVAASAHQASAWAAVLSAFLVALGALVAQNALVPVQTLLAEVVTRRIDGFCIKRLMTVGLAGAGIAMLEHPDVLSKLALARNALSENGQTPGAAAGGLLALIARYAQLIGALAIVGVVLGPVAATVIGAAAVAVRMAGRGSLARWSSFVEQNLAVLRRRMRYVFDTASDTAMAKEARVLGILPWLRARAATESYAFYAPWWRQRRRIYFSPFLALSAVVLAATMVVLLQLRGAAVAGTVSVLGLSLAIQAILVPLRMGTFFPECDLQTMYGMLAHDMITDLERLSGEPAGHGNPKADNGRSGSCPAGLPEASIRFENVRFRYPGSDRETLSGLDLELAAGSSTAIVGLNGSGKTTLVKLLARLYEPTSGRITVDGTDLREFDVSGWQRRLAVIFQDYVKYPLDAAANIGLGAPDYLDNEAALLVAADRAGARGLLAALPAGLATPLSGQYAGGIELSGGEWQRVALARALLAVGAGASVLVLDEPTAQFDARAEVAFYDRFLDLTQGLTTVVISHRFSTVRRADHIAVLADGRVCENGSHDELLRTGGKYAELFQLQARRFVGDGPWRDAPAETGELP